MLARVALWTLALGLVAWAVWLWPAVPARVPLHFGADGTPDRWGERSLLVWLVLPALGVALAALFDGVARWSVRNLESPMLNLPGKEDVLALPPERRAPVLRHVASMNHAAGAVCVGALALIQLGMWASVDGEGGAGWILAGTAVAIVGPLAAVALGARRVRAEARRQQTR